MTNAFNKYLALKCYNWECSLQCLSSNLANASTIGTLIICSKTVPWICHSKEKWVLPTFKSGPLLENPIPLASYAILNVYVCPYPIAYLIICLSTSYRCVYIVLERVRPLCQTNINVKHIKCPTITTMHSAHCELIVAVSNSQVTKQFVY